MELALSTLINSGFQDTVQILTNDPSDFFFVVIAQKLPKIGKFLYGQCSDRYVLYWLYAIKNIL